MDGVAAALALMTAQAQAIADAVKISEVSVRRSILRSTRAAPSFAR
jgi:hypothetical protein